MKMSNSTPGNAVSQGQQDIVAASERRNQLIQQKAYAIALSRGFSKGDALSDWLEAEIKVDGKMPKNPNS